MATAGGSSRCSGSWRRRRCSFVVRLRHRLAWSRLSIGRAHRQMESLLAATRPDADRDAVASGYARQCSGAARSTGTGMISGRRLEGVEHLVGAGTWAAG